MAELLEMTERTLSEKLGENIVTIDMRSVNPFTDYFVIVTARNLRHASSLADDLIEEAEKQGFPVRTREGEEGSSWILVDLYNVIVHIFTEEGRMQYRLENLWGDLPAKRYEE
ncbi:MAG: ribosome silencing factor [Solobacterium sp.]|jgi:ribosome-associated protein|nr:ribosome silencing factor [Solobacterium sp.]MBQ6356361.1 ribosome silencing factor [Solobacterium sp.]MBQ6532548.1 ribosome silencing factor [Solobacterium sp.]MBR0214002.1 ribosome silencing factor [Solobacterium sp.]